MKGLKVEEGVIQDATFITADPGHKKGRRITWTNSKN